MLFLILDSSISLLKGGKMGFICNVFVFNAYILVVHYGAVHARLDCSYYDYDCPPGNPMCCYEHEDRYRNRRNTTYNNVILPFIMAAVISATFISCSYILCTWCCRPRSENGVVFSTGVVGNTGVSSFPFQSLPQEYPGSVPAQSQYPINAAYNPYYGVPPPEYLPTAPKLTAVSTQHTATMVPVPSAPPAIV